LKKEEKRKIVQELKEKLASVRGAYVTEYRGLDVAKISDLRRKLREVGAEYKVIKNTLLKRAAVDVALKDAPDLVAGPTALVLFDNDPVPAAKVIKDYAKTNDKLVIKGGYLVEQLLEYSQIIAIADLPSRDVLLAQVLGSINAPISGFVNVNASILRGLLNALTQIQEQKEAA
jgi:large subunit ribosomal protein L10